MWIGFVGKLNKEHPEYRIGGRVMLDFKHKGVRDFKLAILREAAEAGADGLSLDYAVYPPFFEEPDGSIMTQFVRDVRAMLDDVGTRQQRRLDLMVRVPYRDSIELGLDWKTWAREGLIGFVVPTHLRPTDAFDIPVEEFVEVGMETGVKVYPTIWLALGFVTTDSEPSDKSKKRRRYDKPKTREMYYAQAALFQRSGADGLQVAMSGDAWCTRPWLNDLADPTATTFADKHYMADPRTYLPVTFPVEHSADRLVQLRIADDVALARAESRRVEATLVFYSRPLKPGERLDVFVNAHGPATVSGDSAEERAREGQGLVNFRARERESFIFDRHWWRRGEHRVTISPDWLRLGHNTIRFRHRLPGERAPALSMQWVDLLVTYGQ